MPDSLDPHAIDGYRQFVGRTITETDAVCSDAVDRIAAALDGTWDTPSGSLPAMWHYGLFAARVPTRELDVDGHPRRGGFLPPVSLPRRMFAGSELTFHRALCGGVPATRVSGIASVDHKSGKSGDLVFVRVRLTISQADNACIEELQTIVYRGAGGRIAPVVATPPQPLAANETGEAWTPTRPELFRYSSVTFNAHRIHYDQPYVTQTEGYPDLVVHGPLTATRLHDLARKVAGRPLTRFNFRGEAPVFVDQPVRLVATPDGAGWRLRAERCDGATAMSASAW